MQEVYKGHQIVITPIPPPSRPVGRHGLSGKGWVIKVDDQDVTYEVLQVATKDLESVVKVTKKYIDKMAF